MTAQTHCNLLGITPHQNSKKYKFLKEIVSFSGPLYSTTHRCLHSD